MKLRKFDHTKDTTTKVCNFTKEDMEDMQNFLIDRIKKEPLKTIIIEDMYRRSKISEDFLIVSLTLLVDLYIDHMINTANQTLNSNPITKTPKKLN